MSLEVLPYEFRELHVNRRSGSDVSVLYDERWRRGNSHSKRARRPWKFLSRIWLQTRANCLEFPVRIPQWSSSTKNFNGESMGFRKSGRLPLSVAASLRIPRMNTTNRGTLRIMIHEAWVYRHLPHYQGLLIPYFFGLSTRTHRQQPGAEFLFKFVFCVHNVDNDIYDWRRTCPRLVWSMLAPPDSGKEEQAVDSESVGSDMA
ncbi:hypothetical protein C8J57DRAFT_1222443 [Mycena rebaudengoi]|nr:hypothetical protein C8J57DRAFT_1222443 [Mycena rebaudengoi]